MANINTINKVLNEYTMIKPPIVEAKGKPYNIGDIVSAPTVSSLGKKIEKAFIYSVSGNANGWSYSLYFEKARQEAWFDHDQITFIKKTALKVRMND